MGQTTDSSQAREKELAKLPTRQLLNRVGEPGPSTLTITCGTCGHEETYRYPIGKHPNWASFEDEAEHPDTFEEIPYEVEFHRCPTCGRVDAWAGRKRGWVLVFEGAPQEPRTLADTLTGMALKGESKPVRVIRLDEDGKPAHYDVSKGAVTRRRDLDVDKQEDA